MRILKRRPAAEFRVCVEALVAITAVRLALVCLPVRSVRRGLWNVLARPASSSLSLSRVVRCVTAAVRLSPVPSTCLSTALIAEALLRRYGHHADLRVGVRRASGKFGAHAWLESEGSVIVGGPLEVIEEYTAFPNIEQLIS